ncbi:2'-5' RNA ligase [Allocatelliglobosispora scoriae]|uniref:2'-5' RNA ligase n=1 Tax=Allocatelliglobosispora scoriae TaxID=643052 RepID=A0A841BSR5_9ACTN|nr:2'-5' RNA ligase family protein [Allocatelliglobosispora scoriae]MBB5870436.1 2'-5' RNA ligase [Allocatelliglobosispora scoriae]
MLHSKEGTIRIGVAFDVPPPWGPELTRARAESGDPQAATIPAHVTLLGPTEIDPDQLSAVEEHLAAVAADHHAFELLLRGTGTFRPISEVVFVAIASGISECELLAREISAIDALTVPRAYPYHPHVTVAQDVPPDALDRIFEQLATFEARFPVGGFTLFTHTGELRSANARWHPQRDYELPEP